MEFIAIDVETANSNMASICQIGIAKFSNGMLVEEWSSLIDPEGSFNEANIDVHGIDSSVVVGAPKFSDVAERISFYLSQSISVCHTHFDRVAISKVYSKYQLSCPNIQWLDSAKVVRRVWPEFSERGYGLSNVCEKIGYTFKHHDALEDAKAAGFVLISALRDSGKDINYWLEKTSSNINSGQRKHMNSDIYELNSSVKKSGNPNGLLYGEVIVFTGNLMMSRDMAADLAASLGCEVALNVTKKTTILVVGAHDPAVLAGHEKSSKHRKAEEISNSGGLIKIIGESSFMALILSSGI